MVEWLAKLRASGLRVGVLSNMPFEMWEALAPRQTWLDLCDEITLSYELRLGKPEPDIYRHSLERLGLQPHETLFVDDREENVEAAVALGLQAIRFAGIERLRAELTARFGAAVPLP